MTRDARTTSRRAANKSSRGRRRSFRLEVVELESRTMLSASPLVALPNLDAPLAGTVQVSYTPQQINQAYGFTPSPTANGAGQTIAIIDAYDAPNVATDLTAFNTQFGLPATTLIKTSPTGVLPAPNVGWATEITLDVEWAHAIAPAATILLVEAASASDTNLLAAVDTATSYNAAGVAPVSVVSMSWGGGEFTGETALDSHFTTPSGHVGITFVASAGDSGAKHGVEWPAASPNVLSVGGTTLTLTKSNNYSKESAWSGGGGGYSKLESEPSYQQSVQKSGARTVPDVAYDANPNSGVPIYFTAPGSKVGSLLVVGGTSIGAPQWSGLVAIANQGRVAVGSTPLASAQAVVYSLPASSFHDVTTGSNGFKAAPGYDLATGRGSPNASLVIAGLVAAATPAIAGKPATASAAGNASSSTTAQPHAVAADSSLTAVLIFLSASPVAPIIPTTPVTIQPVARPDSSARTAPVDTAPSGFPSLQITQPSLSGIPGDGLDDADLPIDAGMFGNPGAAQDQVVDAGEGGGE